MNNSISLKDLPLEIGQSMNSLELSSWLGRRFSMTVDPDCMQIARNYNFVKKITKRFSQVEDFFEIDYDGKYLTKPKFDGNAELYFYQR